MCFSAPATFGCQTMDSPPSERVSESTARKEDKILAAIPILFAIQQFSEGIQWIYLNSGSYSLIAGYLFLFFAFIFWPIYVPATVYLLDKKERKILGWFLTLGILVSIYFLVVLTRESLIISKINYCISYDYNFTLKNFIVPAYLLVIVGSLCISSIRILRWFGIIAGFLGLISWLFFELAFTSVWCFFAAIVSVMFFIYIKYKRKVNLLLANLDKKIDVTK